MRGMPLLLFVVTLPVVAALGHDLYLFYLNQDMGFKFAALGWIWTRYEPDSYKTVFETTEGDYWPYINALLAQKAFFVTLGFASIFYVLALFMKIIGVGGEKEIKNFTGNKRVDEMLGNKKGAKMKYKRK